MTGVGMMMMADGPYGGGSPPALSVSINWSSTDPYNVSGASGLTTATFNYSATGGTPPYTFGNALVTNPSGKLGITAPSNTTGPGTFHATWSGFTVGESENGLFQANVTDSLGAYNSKNLSLTIQRTS